MADGPAIPNGGLMSFLPMLVFIAILYFLLIRPQQKRTKQHKALIAAVKKGDKIVTNCGILATVSKVVNDHEVVLEIADGIHCKFLKSAISNVVNADVVPSVPQISSDSKNTVDLQSKAPKIDTESPQKTPIENLAVEKKVAKGSKSDSPVKRRTPTKK
ncbi:MAG: preprotein translocase subunit YajC [Holosporales bacterium]|jgi:preprotein translocase subunit YajC|nr:preprotein translocase subunit YajC [Holosporales bacterium]